MTADSTNYITDAPGAPSGSLSPTTPREAAVADTPVRRRRILAALLAILVAVAGGAIAYWRLDTGDRTPQAAPTTVTQAAGPATAAIPETRDVSIKEGGNTPSMIDAATRNAARGVAHRHNPGRPNRGPSGPRPGQRHRHQRHRQRQQQQTPSVPPTVVTAQSL
ncbi:hypothetical protein [Nocardia amamiensis]|uniref:hypothetical protein n=1 Tax=Nocardia amamiensis TaxID=404578 RepID=UPI000AC24682|nr:hypothetical protein [Nocardia amamiensis]